MEEQLCSLDSHLSRAGGHEDLRQCRRELVSHVGKCAVAKAPVLATGVLPLT